MATAVARWWDRSDWNWHDHGQPGNMPLSGPPGAVSWVQEDGVSQINVFFRGANGDGHLIEAFWDGVTDDGMTTAIPRQPDGIHPCRAYLERLTGSWRPGWLDADGRHFRRSRSFSRMKHGSR